MILLLNKQNLEQKNYGMIINQKKQRFKFQKVQEILLKQILGNHKVLIQMEMQNIKIKLKNIGEFKVEYNLIILKLVKIIIKSIKIKTIQF